VHLGVRMWFVAMRMKGARCGHLHVADAQNRGNRGKSRVNRQPINESRYPMIFYLDCGGGKTSWANFASENTASQPHSQIFILDLI